MTHDYKTKLAESQDAMLQAKLDGAYRALFPDRAVIRLEYDDTQAFQSQGRDLRVVLRGTRGNEKSVAVYETIEEKIRSPQRSRYPDLLIEYLSNRERATLGWIYTSQADWLSYVRQPSTVSVLILPMPDLRAWFVPRLNQYPDLTPDPATRVGDEMYHTANKIVSFRDADFRRFVAAHGYRWLTV